MQGVPAPEPEDVQGVAEVTFEAKVVMDLLRRANRAEAGVIEGVALAAGMLWRCRDRDCSHLMGAGDRYCDRCHLAREA